MPEATSIDDILTANIKPTVPQMPQQEAIEDSNNTEDSYDSDQVLLPPEPIEESEQNESIEESAASTDAYGNEMPKAKTYTEDEVNERINRAVRDRLERLERNRTPEQKEAIEQAKKNFEYDENSNESWQTQLESFVEQTLDKRINRQIQQQQEQKERQIQQEFETKFHTGMSKFPDFVDIVGKQPITDAMTIATRAMDDPAAFLYAASRQQPQELERIARIPDHYTQMVEIGKLEERMRKTRAATSAPKPLSPAQSDTTMPQSKERREPTIEELIAMDEKRRRDKIMSRTRR